jgi:hypothetical protein
MPFAVRSSSLALTRLLSSCVCFWVSIIPFHEALPAWRQPYNLSNPNMKIRTLCLVNCLKPIISGYSLPSNENIFHPILIEVLHENINGLVTGCSSSSLIVRAKSRGVKFSSFLVNISLFS